MAWAVLLVVVVFCQKVIHTKFYPTRTKRFELSVCDLGPVSQKIAVFVSFRFFVRDGIPSVADYNSTLMGVVVVVVVVIVAIFTMG